MTLSVAVCTYNGERFIREQIESILTQTTPVNEIVVCDDGSVDNTIKIIEELKEKTSIKIIVNKNPQTLGICANFQEAVDLCNGDIVFLSDQDDIWYPHKVETIIQWFDNNPDKSVVFTNADLFDEKGNNININGEQCKVWDYYFTENDRKMFKNGLALECMMKPHATGASIAIRKSFIDKNPFINHTNSQAYHDLAICINAVESKQLGYINKTLFKYRIHKEQQIGILGRTRDPQGGDWRCPFYPDDYIAELLHNDKNIERIGFLSWRIWTKHRIHGPIIILFAWHKYHHYYSKKHHTIMTYDMLASFNHTKLRISRKLKSICS